MSTAPLISIIMPTFNSAKTLSLSLESVARQSVERSLWEVLVVDGGSVDQTQEIARAFGCRVLRNEHVQPEFAKMLGLGEARGKYVMFLDSDEVLCDDRSLEKKLQLLQNHPEVRNIVTAGYKNPEGYPGINEYLNRFGEPFSFFMYGIDGGDYLNSLKSKYRTRFEDPTALIVEFADDDVLPICDAGGHFFDLSFLKQIADIRRLDTVPVVFQRMAQHTRTIAVIRGDYTLHYSTTTLRRYLRKIEWRVISNVHGKTGTEGFVTREHFHPKWFQAKKYLFPLYACTMVGPLFDAVRLAIRYRAPAFLIHFPITLYTAAFMALQYARKVFGIGSLLASYGE